MKKKSILYIFIFIIGLCLIDNVNADQGCSYKATLYDYNNQSYYNAIKSGTELPEPRATYEYTIEITKNDKNEISIKSLADKVGIRELKIPDDYASTMFVTDNDNLYCPDQIYMNFENSKKNSVKYSFSTNKRTDVTKTSGPVSYTLTNLEAVNGAKVYTPQKRGSTLVPCKTGGFQIANDIKTKADDYKKKVDDATGEQLLIMQGNLKNLSSNISSGLNQQYCEVDEFRKASKSVENANSVIAKKIADSSMTNSEKEISKANESAISNEIEKANEIIASKVNQITIKEGNILNCEELLDKDLKDVIKWVLKIVRIAVPILLIVLVTIDFSSAVISQDQDSIKKATSKAIKRGIAALAFFFIPLFVNVMLDWLLKYSPITVTKTNEAGETVKVEMRDISCEEVLKGDSDI